VTTEGCCMLLCFHSRTPTLGRTSALALALTLSTAPKHVGGKPKQASESFVRRALRRDTPPIAAVARYYFIDQSLFPIPFPPDATVINITHYG
jgi:hypothetical protein